jgi:hypothetical protein
MALATLLLAASFAAPALAQDAAGAPAGSPDTRYCMRIEAVTGSRLERIRCWTRDEWAEQGVDLDRDWPTEGVRTID